MEDITILEAVERYISGSMDPDERAYFDNLRKSSPEIDQLVVEHTFFLQQMNRFDETRKLKSALNDVHIDLAEQGLIDSTERGGRTKVISLINKYKRTAAIAASIAGLTALTMSALLWSVSPVKPAAEISQLKNDISALKNQNKQQNKEIDQIKNGIIVSPVIYKTGGTGFLINTKGLLVTNAHVVSNANNIAVQNNDGADLRARVVYTDIDRDIAILKIEDSAFKTSSPIPYTIKQNSGEIAEQVYTLGYPRNDIVYGEGYLSAKTGFHGDTLSYQIAIDANPGNSGGPILNKNGEIIGILSAKQNSAEGVVFATQSKYIFKALNELGKDSAVFNNKLNTVSQLKGLSRQQQVKKVSNFIYLVKVN
jgi:S1-C subfamily serine protease